MVSILAFSELTNYQLYECLKLRCDVFVCEQKCIYPELDNKDIDDNSFHALMYCDNQLAAYARILPAGLSYQSPSIGRVLVAEGFRGRGFAETIMNTCIKFTFKAYACDAIEIGAQCYLQSFYQKLGFKTSSKPYDEDGIMHVDMRLSALDAEIE